MKREVLTVGMFIAGFMVGSGFRLLWRSVQDIRTIERRYRSFEAGGD